MGDWNSEELEGNTSMETQELTNTIRDINGYSDARSKYQWSKDWPIHSIYCSAHFAEIQRGFLSFGRLVGDHQSLWFEINGKMLLGLQKNDIITPMARKSHLGYPRTIKKLNAILHTIFDKHDIYQKIHYINNHDIYPPPTDIERAFEILDKFIPHLMHAEDKNTEEKRGNVKWSPEYKKSMDLVELWVLLKTRCDTQRYNGRRLTQLQQNFPHGTPNVNNIEITIGIISVYSGRKVEKTWLRTWASNTIPILPMPY